MWEVFIWVPSRKWTLVGTEKTERDAHILASQFQPLETKVKFPNGDFICGGVWCRPQVPNSLWSHHEYLARYVPDYVLKWSQTNLEGKMLLTIAKCNEFATQFKTITGQNVEDWLSYENLQEAGKEDDPCAVSKAIEEVVVGEIVQVIEKGEFQASYLRDLAQLLLEIRTSKL